MLRRFRLTRRLLISVDWFLFRSNAAHTNFAYPVIIHVVAIIISLVITPRFHPLNRTIADYGGAFLTAGPQSVHQ